MKPIWSLVITSLLVAGPVYAEDATQDAANASPPAQPNAAPEAAVLDSVATANTQLQEAEAHLKEARDFVAQGKTDAAVEALKEYETTFSGVTNQLDAASQHGQDVSQALRTVDRATQKHTEVLTDLLQRVPAQAQPAIWHALEVSQRGRTHALDNLRALGQAEAGAGHQPGDMGNNNMGGKGLETPGRSEEAGLAGGQGRRPAWSGETESPSGVGGGGVGAASGWGSGHGHGRR